MRIRARGAQGTMRAWRAIRGSCWIRASGGFREPPPSTPWMCASPAACPLRQRCVHVCLCVRGTVIECVLASPRGGFLRGRNIYGGCMRTCSKNTKLQCLHECGCRHDCVAMHGRWQCCPCMFATHRASVGGNMWLVDCMRALSAPLKPAYMLAYTYVAHALRPHLGRKQLPCILCDLKLSLVVLCVNSPWRCVHRPYQGGLPHSPSPRQTHTTTPLPGRGGRRMLSPPFSPPWQRRAPRAPTWLRRRGKLPRRCLDSLSCPYLFG